MQKRDTSLEKFESLISQLNPLSVLYFAVATLFIPGNQEEAYGDLEFIVANASSMPIDKDKKECDPELFQELVVLSENIRRKQVFDNIFDFKEAKDAIRVGFYSSRASVRLKAYPHQMLEAAYHRFRSHDNWLKKELGFTIEDCIDLANFFEKKLLEKLGPIVKSIDKEFVKEVRKEPPFIKIPKSSFLPIVRDAVTFSKEEISDSLDIPEQRLENILIRLSNKLGRFPKIENHMDFNDLYKTPIVNINDAFVVPFFPTYCQAISETFYYDVIERDPDYLPEFEKKKGEVSEGRAFRYLSRAIPPDFLFPNQKFQDKMGEHEIADILILFNDILLIVQNKSKLLTEAAQKGDIEAIKTDLQNSVLKAYDQCIKAKENLLAGELTSLTNNRWKDVPLNISNIHKIYFVITLEDRFPILLLKDLESFAEVDFKKDGYPFIVNLYDLAIITSELSTPFEFTKYLEKRIKLNSKGIIGIFDELDLLGYYLSNERDFRLPVLEDGQTPNFVVLVGHWEEFNKSRLPLLRRKFERDKYSLFIDEVTERAHECNDLNAFEVITNLSKLSRTERRVVGMKALEKSMQAASNGKLHYASVKPENVAFGISLLFSPASREERKKQLVSISSVAQYISKSRLWIGIASEPADAKLRSYDYLWLEKEWEPDPQLEKLAKEMFKPPERISEYEY